MRNAFRRAVTAHLVSFIPFLTTSAVVASAALLTGCSSGDDDAVTPPPIGTTGVPIMQDNNFTYVSTLTPASVKTAPEEDLSISWGDVATDIQGHAFSPADVKKLVFIPVDSSMQTQVSAWLNSGQFSSGMTNGTVYELPAGAGTINANLSDFQSTADASVHPDLTQDYNVDPALTYLLVLQNQTALGYGALTMTFLVPKDGESNTDVPIKADSSSMLSFAADLHSLKHLSVSADSIVDWSKVANDGQGNPISATAIDSVHVGFYADRTVTDDLEPGFLNLEQATPDAGGPDMSWEITVASGKKASFANGKGRHGEDDFASFATDGKTGVWLMAMFCSSCQNPAPLIVTILDPQ